MTNAHAGASHGAQPPPSAKTDEDIREDVLCQMAWDDRLTGHQLGVQVENGIVTLGGVVDDWIKFNAAAEAAHRVPEVQDVANEITVRAALVDAPTDTDVATAIRRALRWDARLQEEEIRCTVTHGVVTLDGVVPSVTQRREATRVVEQLHGVKRVENRLRIVEGP
jgi:osmotically-inducible protein OsmY